MLLLCRTHILQSIILTCLKCVLSNMQSLPRPPGADVLHATPEGGGPRPCRELAKAVQSELAEANTVAEEALSAMATVRSHAAEDSARAAYGHRLRLFYRLCVRPTAPSFAACEAPSSCCGGRERLA